MSDLYVLGVFAFALVIMILMISKWHVHPVITLLIVVIAMGLALGTGAADVLLILTEGVGGTIGRVGLIIFLGCALGKILESSGACLRLTNAVYSICGPRKAIWAIAGSAAIVGVPVFADAVVIILMPVVVSLAIKTKSSIAKFAAVLYLGAYVSSSLIPPTPGPVAAASFLGLDMAQAIIWGGIVAVPGVLAGTLYVRFINIGDVDPKLHRRSHEEEPDVSHISLIKAMTPILLPIALIIIGTIPLGGLSDHFLGELVVLVSDPAIALLLGVISSFPLLGHRWRSKEVLNDWMETGLRLAAMPIMVTGLGGALALLVRDTGIAESLASTFVELGLAPLLLPFVLGAAINTITGSNTLGVLTSAAIVQPLLPSLGLSPLSAFLACASGSLILKHPNSSGFWVTVSLSGMTVAQGIKAIGGATLCAGIASGTATYLLYSLGWI